MQTKTVLNIPSYPQLVQDFAIENFNLKVLSSVSLALLFVSLATVAYLVKRPPTVVALAESGKVAKLDSAVTDYQIKEAIKEYLSHRYSWNVGSIAGELRKAEFFVEPELIPSFRKSMTDTIKFVREKKVNQRVYPNETSVKVDIKQRIVRLTADRFTEFDGLKAATEMKLVLNFDIGEQSNQNPWGVYVTKEVEGGGAR